MTDPSANEDATSAYAATVRVRDLVNRPAFRAALMEDTWRYHRVCATMDAIEDASAAIAAFFRRPHVHHLDLYGVLQALIIQQDATKVLVAALELPAWDHSESDAAKAIRRYRNVAAGHPADLGNGRKVGQVSYGSIRHSGFELSTVTRTTGERTRETVPLGDLAVQQQADIVGALTAAAEVLTQREREHRGAFRDDPVSPLLHPSWDHQVQKLSEAARDPDGERAPIAGIASACLREMVDRVVEALDARDRGPSRIEPVAHSVATTERLLAAIDERLPTLVDRTPDRETVVAALAHHLRSELTDLVDLLAEIDAEFASDEV